MANKFRVRTLSIEERQAIVYFNSIEESVGYAESLLGRRVVEQHLNGIWHPIRIFN